MVFVTLTYTGGTDLAGGEGVVAGRLREMSGVVEGEDADIAWAAEFETVDAAV